MLSIEEALKNCSEGEKQVIDLKTASKTKIRNYFLNLHKKYGGWKLENKEDSIIKDFKCGNYEFITKLCEYDSRFNKVRKAVDNLNEQFKPISVILKDLSFDCGNYGPVDHTKYTG